MSFARVLGPFRVPPFKTYAVSPLGLVPKKDSDEYRLIHDLSYPKKASVNSFIPSHFTAVKYETLDLVMNLFVGAGKNALIAETDIESAYRIVPVHPSSIHLLGMMCDDMFYFDAFLPFGLPNRVPYLELSVEPSSGY